MTLSESEDDEQIIERVAALDIAKDEVVCCVRLPAPAGGKRRLQEISTHSTMVGALSDLAERLVDLGIERVVMEATSDYWKPIFYVLEAHGLDPWLVNAKDVKHLPGRPKTDTPLDAVWLCKVAERQMLRPSFVPPPPIRRLRDFTRYRSDLVNVRTAEKNRVEKLLEDACVKLSLVASDIDGVSGRAMMDAIVAGERDPRRLAELARSRMRTKIPQLEQAFAASSPGPSTSTTASCSPPCWPVSTPPPTVTSPRSMIRSPSTWPLSLTRPLGSMRSPGSGRSRPPPSSPRSAWT